MLRVQVIGSPGGCVPAACRDSCQARSGSSARRRRLEEVQPGLAPLSSPCGDSLPSLLSYSSEHTRAPKDTNTCKYYIWRYLCRTLADTLRFTQHTHSFALLGNGDVRGQAHPTEWYHRHQLLKDPLSSHSGQLLFLSGE